MELLFYDEMEETVGSYLAAAHGFFVRFVVGLAIYAESHFLGCFAEQFFFRDAQPFHKGLAGSADAVGTVFPDDFFPAVLEKGLPERLGRIGCVRGKGFGCDAVAAKHLPEEGTQLFLVVNGWFGNEKEDVLMMDDEVQNQTIPLILCAEEDVVGNHGATIGRLDDSLMFYLESRGMDRDQIYEMMAKARLDSVIRLIPDEKWREDINTWLGGTEDDNE